MVVPIRIAMSSGTTNKLDEMSNQLIVSTEGGEAQLDNSLDVTDMELTNEGVNDDWDKKLAPQLIRQAANVKSLCPVLLDDM